MNTGNLFIWGQKVKGQGHEKPENMSAWVFVLLWVTASSSCYLATADVVIRI